MKSSFFTPKIAVLIAVIGFFPSMVDASEYDLASENTSTLLEITPKLYPVDQPLGSVEIGAKFRFRKSVKFIADDMISYFQSGLQMDEQELSPDHPACALTASSPSNKTRVIKPESFVKISYQNSRLIDGNTHRTFIMFQGPSGSMGDNKVNALLCDQVFGNPKPLTIREIAAIFPSGLLSTEFERP